MLPFGKVPLSSPTKMEAFDEGLPPSQAAAHVSRHRARADVTHQAKAKQFPTNT